MEADLLIHAGLQKPSATKSSNFILPTRDKEIITKIQLAVISPEDYLQDFCIVQGGTVQLILSQWVRESTTYTAFFADRAQGNYGDYVILDNSAHEMSVGDSVESLVPIIKLIKPQEVVLPDRLFFGDDTLERSIEASGELKGLFPDLNLMAVPQGRTFSEWKTCLDGLLELPIHTIGLSKDYEGWPGGLLYLVDQVPEHIQIHLLGWPRELHLHGFIERSRPGRVRSTDSAKPIVYGMNEIGIPEIGECTHVEFPYPRRSGTPLKAQLSEGQKMLAIANIFRFRESIKDSSVGFKDLWKAI